MNRLLWLEEQLEDEDLSPQLRVRYDAEAAALAANLTWRQEKEKKALETRKVQLAELRAKLEADDQSVIDAFGIPEFGDDYEIIEEGSNHVTYSKVARPDQESRWVFPNREEADRKYRKLVWDRLYSKYVRVGEVDHLSELGV